jgi:class 3 adenylate cyclase/tetratricopeptide (TPR) repeat protein
MRDCAACGESNPARARFCLACGQPLEGGAEPAPELRRSISVIFADLVGSTMLGESLDAEALRYVTGRYFDTMRAAAERHGGTVEKFIGDAVVVLFGVPRVREDDALRAVRAAADMRAALSTLNDELQRDVAVALQIRVGVNTGEVIIGERRAGGSAATGDAVNVAARLEQAADPGQVLIGEGTVRLVRDRVQVEPVEPLRVKGKTEPVVAWRLVDVAASARPATSPSTDLFVGRDPQLRLLDEAFRRTADERTCQLVTVLGVAGIGKSRLAEEFTATVSAATVLTGRCLSYGQGATYWPLREAALSAVGLTGDEPASSAQAAFAAVLGDGPDAANVVSRLLALVGYTGETSVPEDVPWAMRLFLEGLARRQPVILVVDDLHWAEPGLLDVLEHTADWSRDSPIMLLGLARPEFYDSRPTWGGGKLNATALLLPALDDAAAASLLGKHDLPGEVQRRIADAAGGNPLFVEQLVAMLVDEGHVALSDGVATWIGGPPAEVRWAMPPSVSALLAARIDRLDDVERTILGCAAVIGTVFYAEAIAALTGGPMPEVQRTLALLVRKELLRTAVTDLPRATAYRFLHVLVRDAAYEGLAKASRATWHERLADWLSGQYGDVVPDEIVGHHLASAWEYRTQLGPATAQVRELAARAARKLAAAGRRLGLSDIAAAASLLQRAADMLEPGDPDRVDCLLSLAAQRLELGQIDQALEALRMAADAADQRQALLAQVLMHGGSMLTADSSAEECEAVVGEAVHRFEEWGDDWGLAEAYLTQGDLAVVRGDLARGTKLFALALKHGEAAGDAGCVARARSLLGIAMMFGPTPAEEVIASLDQMVASSGNDPRVRAEAEQVTCVMHAMCGRFDQARVTSSDARQHLGDVGHGLFLANLAQSTGHVEELARDLDAAEDEYARSCTDLQALGESGYLSTVAGLHARLLGRRGKFAQAQMALELARRHGSPDDVATQSLVRQAEGLLAAAAGEADGARAAVADALARERGGEAPDAVGEARLAAADVERMLGSTLREREHLIAARALFEAKGNVVRVRAVESRLRDLSCRGLRLARRTPPAAPVFAERGPQQGRGVASGSWLRRKRSSPESRCSRCCRRRNLPSSPAMRTSGRFLPAP